MIWKESKWYFKNNIRYTFKLEAYGKLFHFDNEGLKKGHSGFLLTVGGFDHQTLMSESRIHRRATRNSLDQPFDMKF